MHHPDPSPPLKRSTAVTRLFTTFLIILAAAASSQAANTTLPPAHRLSVSLRQQIGNRWYDASFAAPGSTVQVLGQLDVREARRETTLTIAVPANTTYLGGLRLPPGASARLCSTHCPARSTLIALKDVRAVQITLPLTRPGRYQLGFLVQAKAHHASSQEPT